MLSSPSFHPHGEKIKWGLGMTKRILFIFILAFFAANTAHGRGPEIKKTLDDYEVAVKLDKRPPVQGDNPMEIEIKDTRGKSIADAQVLVNYYMPPMPRMAPMNYKTDAQFSGGKYKTTMNIIMSGPWVIRVLITRGGKTSLVKFNLDAQ
jgi:hypothetical protein